MGCYARRMIKKKKEFEIREDYDGSAVFEIHNDDVDEINFRMLPKGQVYFEAEQDGWEYGYTASFTMPRMVAVELGRWLLANVTDKAMKKQEAHTRRALTAYHKDQKEKQQVRLQTEAQAAELADIKEFERLKAKFNQ